MTNGYSLFFMVIWVQVVSGKVAGQRENNNLDEAMSMTATTVQADGEVHTVEAGEDQDRVNKAGETEEMMDKMMEKMEKMEKKMEKMMEMMEEMMDKMMEKMEKK